ncbi:MAG: nucleoside triphosphate pyrophosphohydrolase [Myxococcota bacterium]
MKQQPSPHAQKAGTALSALAELMSRLRAPDGCDWDRAQDLRSLRPYLLEEAHEVLQVLDDLPPDGGGPGAEAHRDELGDLLLQIVFQAELQRESGHFDLGDVCDAVRAKLERRHPHLFGTATEKPDWESVKRAERRARGDVHESALDGVPRELPGLLRALRVGEKAHGVGFDWPDHRGVVAKIEEELDEVKEAIAEGDLAHIADEIGDLLYAIVNLTRHLKVDPEASLRRTISRFERRFRIVEERVRTSGKRLEECSLEELEDHWAEAKRQLAASS